MTVIDEPVPLAALRRSVLGVSTGSALGGLVVAGVRLRDTAAPVSD